MDKAQVLQLIEKVFPNREGKLEYTCRRKFAGPLEPTGQIFEFKITDITTHNIFVEIRDYLHWNKGYVHYILNPIDNHDNYYDVREAFATEEQFLVYAKDDICKNQITIHEASSDWGERITWRVRDYIKEKVGQYFPGVELYIMMDIVPTAKYFNTPMAKEVADEIIKKYHKSSFKYYNSVKQIVGFNYLSDLGVLDIYSKQINGPAEQHRTYHELTSELFLKYNAGCNIRIK
jgi:hypothetical protein